MVIGFENCRFYKRTELLEATQIKGYLMPIPVYLPISAYFTDSFGTRKLKSNYNYFIHINGSIFQLKGLRIDSTLSRIEFLDYTTILSSRQMNYYEKIKNSKYKLRKRHLADRRAIKQVHIFLLDTGSMMKNEIFSNKVIYTHKIQKVEVLKSAHLLNFITNATLIPLEAFLGIYIIYAINYVYI